MEWVERSDGGGELVGQVRGVVNQFGQRATGVWQELAELAEQIAGHTQTAEAVLLNNKANRQIVKTSK